MDAIVNSNELPPNNTPHAAARVTAVLWNEPTARALVECALLHGIPEARRGLGLTMHFWYDRYQALLGQSQERDRRRYHTFGLEVIAAEQVPVGPVTYLTGQARDADGHDRIHLQFTAGQTRINEIPSNEIIV